MLRAILSLSLVLGPAFCLHAEAEAVSPSAQAGAASAPAGVTRDADALSSTASTPPALPDAALDGPAPDAKPAPADLGVPKDSIVAPKAAVPEAKPARFHFGDFALGFLGGALIGGAYGVLSSGGQPQSTMTQNAAIDGGAGGVVLGLLGLLLGATTPPPAKPPQVDEGARPLRSGTLLALSF